MNFQYKHIFSIIEENSDIQPLINKIHKYELISDDSNIFNDIISKLNYEQLKTVDNKIQNVSSKLWEAENEIINLNGKNIKIYKKFFLVNELIFNIIKNKFELDLYSKEFYYTYKNGDIISIYDDLQNTILFGNINIKDNFYDIKCIFDYDEKSALDEEFEKISSLGIEKFINDFGIFSDKNNEDNEITIHSSNNKIIRYFKWKYLNKFNDNNLIEDINNLKQQLDDEKNKNKKLCEDIKLLRLELIEEKNKNKILEKMEKKLKMELENEIKKYKDLIEEISKNIKNYGPKNKKAKDSLLNIILNKDKEIEELKTKLSRYPFELKENEELMTINFKSFDNKINNYSLLCKNTDIFYDIEKKFHKDNKDDIYNNFYTVNGIKIFRYKSLKEYNIKNNDR